MSDIPEAALEAAARAMYATLENDDEQDIYIGSGPDDIGRDRITVDGKVDFVALAHAALAAAIPLLGEAKPFDMLAHLARQREWSSKTFGPGDRAKGVVDHIRKELHEIEADPTDLSEWIDVVILALDGAWRAGYSPEQILAQIVAKQAKNEARVWPDWRTMPADKAIEHDRTADARPSNLLARVLEVLDAILAEGRNLRLGGPDPMDLQNLSEGLSVSVDLAGTLRDEIEKELGR